MIVGYIRVSSVDQNTARQLDGIKLDKVFEEKLSGKNITDRPELKVCLNSLNSNDKLYIQSMHLIATNNNQLYAFLCKIKKIGCGVIFTDDDLLVSSCDSLSLFEKLKNFETKAVKERQSIGREKAKLKGVVIGKNPLPKHKIEEVARMNKEGYNAKDISNKLNIGTSTVYKYLR